MSLHFIQTLNICFGFGHKQSLRLQHQILLFFFRKSLQQLLLFDRPKEIYQLYDNHKPQGKPLTRYLDKEPHEAEGFIDAQKCGNFF